MKKILLTIVCVIATCAFVSAQNTFEKSDKVITLGIGFGNTLHSGGGFSTKIPPLVAAFEYCVVDNLFDANSSIGVGGYVGYTSSKSKFSQLGVGYQAKFSDFIIGVRGALHYQFVKNLDTYFGLSIT